MSGITTTDELLNRAFHLAYFILGDRTASIYVAMAAVDKLKIASIIQDRRLYYVPTGRSTYPAARSKVSLSHIHLLQRLIYTESEPFERLIEGQEKPLKQHDMIIRFIKHLVKVTTRHNSFYVALGLCRLLHNYTTGETAEIYNLLIQDPDRGRDDYYYRSRKKHVLHELKERFGKSVKTYRGHRGEERFQLEENSERYVGLVKECLSRFMPWESSCVLPANIDPIKDIVAPLQFNGKEPDEEHEIELNRIHTLLHPDCLERLVMTLGLDSPVQRLEIPHFFKSSADSDLTDERLNSKALSEGELDAMRRYLGKNSVRRKNTSGRLLAILVDGDDRSYFEIDQTNSVRINVAEDAELIEILSVEAGEEILLAIHPLTCNERGIAAAKFPITLGAGQRLSFEVQPLDGSSAEATGAMVSINYQEKRAIRQVSSLLQRLRVRLADRISPALPGRVNYLKFALGSLCIAMCMASFLIYLYSRNALPDQQMIVEQKEIDKQDKHSNQPSALVHATPPQAQAGAQPQPSTPRPLEASGPHDQRRHNQSLALSSQRRFSPDSSLSGEIEATRGRQPGPASLMLLAVKRVYVDPLGEERVSWQVREMLIKNLQSSGHFVVVENRDEADAVFKGSAGRVSKGGEDVSIVLRLINAKGQVIWSTASKRYQRIYSGDLANSTDRIKRDLLSDIQRLEGKR